MPRNAAERDYTSPSDDMSGIRAVLAEPEVFDTHYAPILKLGAAALALGSAISYALAVGYFPKSTEMEQNAQCSLMAFTFAAITLGLLSGRENNNQRELPQPGRAQAFFNTPTHRDATPQNTPAST